MRQTRGRIVSRVRYFEPTRYRSAIPGAGAPAQGLETVQVTMTVENFSGNLGGQTGSLVPLQFTYAGVGYQHVVLLVTSGNEVRWALQGSAQIVGKAKVRLEIEAYTRVNILDWSQPSGFYLTDDPSLRLFLSPRVGEDLQCVLTPF